MTRRFMLGTILMLLLTGAALGRDLDEDSQKFLDECRYIITDIELRMFKALQTPEERHRFIQNFWKGLDPNPLTAVNEYKDLYYQRIEEANRLFTRGKPGYLSDRGKIYVLMGPPDEKESHYSGRKADEHPSEIWIYRSARHKGLDRDTEVAFIDETGTGNYRLASRTEIEGGAARAGAVAGMRADLMALGTMVAVQGNPRETNSEDLATKIAQAQAPAPPSEEAAAAPATELKATVKPRYDFFKASEGKTLVAMTVSLDRATASGGASDYKVFAKLESKVPDPLIPTQDLVDKFQGKESDTELLYQAQAPLVPGEYRVLYGVTEIATNATKSFEDAITAPGYADDAFGISSVVPATKVEKSQGDATATTSLTPFELSGSLVVPSVGGKLGKRDELSIYFQAYGAKTDAATGKQKIDVHYLVYRKLSDGKWKPVGKNDLGNQEEMVQVYVIPLSAIGAGEYKVEVKVQDQVGGQTAKGEALFAVK